MVFKVFLNYLKCERNISSWAMAHVREHEVNKVCSMRMEFEIGNDPWFRTGLSQESILLR